MPSLKKILDYRKKTPANYKREQGEESLGGAEAKKLRRPPTGDSGRRGKISIKKRQRVQTHRMGRK